MPAQHHRHGLRRCLPLLGTAHGARGGAAGPPTSVYVSVPGLWRPEAGRGFQAWETKPPALLLGGLAVAGGCHPHVGDPEELRERLGWAFDPSALAPHTQAHRPSLLPSWRRGGRAGKDTPTCSFVFTAPTAAANQNQATGPWGPVLTCPPILSRRPPGQPWGARPCDVARAA